MMQVLKSNAGEEEIEVARVGSSSRHHSRDTESLRMRRGRVNGRLRAMNYARSGQDVYRPNEFRSVEHENERGGEALGGATA